MEKFAKRLKDLRTEKEMTQMQLAFDTKISKSSIAAWELCVSVPNANAIVTLARYFNVSCDYLLGESDYRN